jgi:hypothetical protein
MGGFHHPGPNPEIADECCGDYPEMSYQTVSITIWEILKYGRSKKAFISVKKIEL